MTEKQFQAILSPIYRFEALSGETVEKLTGLEMLTVDVKSLQKETVDQLNKQTTLLGEISTTIKNQVSIASGSSSPVVDSVNLLSLDLKSLHVEHMEEMRNQSTLLKLVVSTLIRGNKDRNTDSSGSNDEEMDNAVKFKPFSVKDTGLAAFMMVSLSAAVVASAGLFSLIPKVSGAQLLTALAVGGTIALLSDTFIKITTSLDKLKGETTASFEGITTSKIDTSAIFATAGATILSMIGMIAAIAVSSWMMQLIMPVAPIKLLTAVLVGVALLALAPTFVKISDSLGKMKSDTKVDAGALGSISATNFSGIWTLMGATLLSMVGFSAAIAMSSWVMQLIIPVAPMKLLTAVLMGLALLALAPTFVKISDSLSKMKLDSGADTGALGSISANNFSGIWTLMGATLLSMVGISAAIAMSSWIFQLIVPVTPDKLLTAFLVGIALTGAAWSYSMILKHIKGKGLKDIGLAGLAIPIIAAGIAAATYIFANFLTPIKDPMVYLTVFLIGLSLITAAYSFSLVMKAVKGASGKDLLKAGAAMVIIAGAIWLTSWIFTQLPAASEFIAPPWKWSLAAGLAIAVFALSFIGLVKGIAGASIKDIAKAAAASVFVAIAIIGVAWMFHMYASLGGTYGAPPEVAWTLKTGLALIVFGASISILAVLVKFLGVKTFVMGVLGAIVVSVGILVVAGILSLLPSTFTEIPMGWSIAVALGIVLFSIPVLLLGLAASTGVGAAAILLGVVGMIVIAGGIWVVAWIFSKLPDISGVAKMLTDSMLAPVNGIVDVLARLKNEIGVDNLLPLAGGIIAISVSLLALAGATAGVAAGGLFSSIANVGKAFFDGIASVFGGEKSKGPLDILSEIIDMAPQIAKVAKPIKILGDAFSFLQGGQNMQVLNRFFELMQLDPKMSNVKAVQEMAPSIRDMVLTLGKLDPAAPSRLKELFGGVSWSSIFTPVASVASSMSTLALSANSAGSGVTSVAIGIERMVAALNTLKKDYIDAVIKLFNEVDWNVLVNPIDAISISMHRMSSNAVDMGMGMKMTSAALVAMSTVSVEILQEITKVFESLALSNLTEQGNAMLLSIAPAIASISATMLVMRSDAYIRMFEVMASSSQAVVAMARPMTQIASAMDHMSKVNVVGIEWAHKMVKQLAISSFNSQATALEKMAKSYADISKSSNSMDVEAINATTDMFKALAYLYQNGRKNAIEELGEKLTDAVRELARMIADFEGTVNEQAEGSKTVGQAMAKAVDRLSSATSKNSGSSPVNSGRAQTVESFQELVDLLNRGIVIRDFGPMAEGKL